VQPHNSSAAITNAGNKSSAPAKNTKQAIEKIHRLWETLEMRLHRASLT
jgi:hypothetical protein